MGDARDGFQGHAKLQCKHGESAGSEDDQCHTWTGDLKQKGLQVKSTPAKSKDHGGDLTLTSYPTSSHWSPSVASNGRGRRDRGDIEEGEIVSRSDSVEEGIISCSNSEEGEIGSSSESLADDGASAFTGATTCGVCWKTFPSNKSFYGHMRCCSKNRRRRSPPPEDNTLASSTPTQEMSSQAAEPPGSPNRPLPPLNWSVARRRAGRKKKRATDLTMDSGNPVIDAANALMLIASGWNPGSTQVTEKQRDERASDPRSENNVGDSEVQWPPPPGSDGSSHLNQKTLRLEGVCSERANLSSCQSEDGRLTLEVNMEEPERTSESAPDAGKPHKCRICAKSFDSHQALGGHMVSHKRNKNSSGVRIPEEIEAPADQLAAPPVEASTGKHKCELCSETFPTGQALGGHKRKHWKRPENPSVVRNFDMNKPPSLGDERDS